MGHARAPRRTQRQDVPVGDTTAAIARGLWNWRLELTLFTLVFLVTWYGRWWVAAASLVALVGPPPNRYIPGWWPRQYAAHILHVAHLRRQWKKATRAVGLEVPPRVGRVRQWPIGDKANIILTSKCTVADVEKNADRLATDMKLADVRVKRGATQDRAELVLVRRDPFADYITGPDGKPVIRPIPWPDRDAVELDMWKPIRIGEDQDGTPVTMALMASNVLLGGVPGSGKSAAESMIVAHAALDPNARLWLMDGKDVDLPVWEPCSHRYVGPDRKDAIEMLKELRDETERRFSDLKAQSARTGKPVRKISKDMGLPIHVLVCDELASYLLAEDKTGQGHAAKILELLRQIASKGRAGGIIECLATQRPDAGTVDTKLRSLLTYRWAMRCTDYQSSDTITGGLASAGYDASDIPEPQKGVGWVVAESGTPTLTRGYYLDDDDIYRIAGRVMERSPHGPSGMPSGLRLVKDGDDDGGDGPAGG